MTGIAEQSGEQSLSVFDPCLSHLASQAALELDNLLLGQGDKLDAVASLGKLLENSTEIVGGGGRSSLMDPTTATMFSRAVAASGMQKVSTVEELATNAWRIAKELEKSSKGAEEEKEKHLKRLRDFCLYLGENAMIQERRFREAHSPNRKWS